MLSFIIPARNEERYITDCLQSILTQQPAGPFEIIVVDNGSTDATVALVKARFPQVIVLTQPVQGTNPARQKALEKASGEVLIFFDADVRLPQGWLDKVLKKLRADDNLVAVSGPYHFYDFPWYLQVLSVVYHYLIAAPWQFFTTRVFGMPSFVIGGNMTIKKIALDRVGGFDESLKFYGDDTDTGIRLKKVGQVVFDSRFWVYSSARRYNKKGLLRTVFSYLMNYFSLLILKKPHETGKYEEIR